MQQTEPDLFQNRIERAAEWIRAVSPEPIDLLLVLGSGLGSLADSLGHVQAWPYADIPGLPAATVPGHAGRLLVGSWSGRRLAVMQGRFHYYEGHAMAEVVLPIRIMQRLGVRKLILTNAAGGLNPAFTPGDLMAIEDHIGLWAESPLRGANLDDFGPRFPDQSHVYDPEYLATALSCAEHLGLTMHRGVYAWCRGPQFETPAEIRLLRRLGVDAVGMSTVPEAIAAVHGGMRVLALSCITNLAAGLLDQGLSHAEVIETGNRVAAGTIRLLSDLIGRL
jgi:purine-nucleoside phosphorylase